MDESLKIVWAYMLQNGKLTDGRWSYYGGEWEGITSDWKTTQKKTKEFLEKVKNVGVDWSKTNHPESNMNSVFTDTFHDAETVETLLGTIFLKDGSEFMVGVSNRDVRFGEYIKLVKRMIEDTQRVKDIFGE